MFANYLIGLREGLEAGLIVGILVAYVVKANRRDVLPKLWVGVGISIVVMLGVGALLTWGSVELSDQAEEIIVGVLSIVAVALVTWMVFWMNSHARGMASELHSKLDTALVGSGIGIVILAFVSVAREGIETAMFVWANVSQQLNGDLAALGAFLGLATAVVLSWLIYRGLVRINLAKFFAWTGGFLIFVAGGVLASAAGELQSAGVLPETAAAYDVSAALSKDSPLGSFLGGVFNFNPAPSWTEFLVWWIYLVVVGGLFIRRIRSGAPRRVVTAPAQ